MTTYAQYLPNRKPSQMQPAPGKNQVQNNASGYVFKVDKWTALKRFLIIGTEGGTYYVSERKLTEDNLLNVKACIVEDTIRVVDLVVEISQSGRAPKNEPALLVLALCCLPDNRHRTYALASLNQVARTGTHLFQFIDYLKKLRCFGRSVTRNVSKWYLEKSLDDLVYQVVKYKRRAGWSHRDVLNLVHPKPETVHRDALFRKLVYPNTAVEMSHPALKRYHAAEELSVTDDAAYAVHLIEQYDLPHEVVNRDLLNHKKVWEALLQKMPMTAMIRNLGKMSSVGLLERYSEHSTAVITKLHDNKTIKFSRIHPINVLLALKTYAQGEGFRGSLKWKANQDIVDALEDAFYASFANVEATGLRYLLGVDVSGSMGWSFANGNLDCRTAAMAMAMVTLRTEKNAIIKGFADNFMDLPISARTSLNEAVKATSGLNFGSTDCALPMLWATKENINIDAFVVYTDNETWAGHTHPFQALKQYRQKTGINAKLIVVGMTATNFSIADPSDPGMLDVVGFDSSVPVVMKEFLTP